MTPDLERLARGILASPHNWSAEAQALARAFLAEREKNKRLEEDVRDYHETLNDLWSGFGREFREHADLSVTRRMVRRLRRGYHEHGFPLAASVSPGEARLSGAIPIPTSNPHGNATVSPGESEAGG